MKVRVIKDSVIYSGKIYKVDESFNCDEAIANSLIERKYCVVDETADVIEVEVVEVADGPVTYKREDLEKMTYRNLQILAKELGINASASKEKIINEICGEDEVETSKTEELADEMPNTSMPE